MLNGTYFWEPNDIVGSTQPVVHQSPRLSQNSGINLKSLCWGQRIIPELHCLTEADKHKIWLSCSTRGKGTRILANILTKVIFCVFSLLSLRFNNHPKFSILLLFATQSNHVTPHVVVGAWTTVQWEECFLKHVWLKIGLTNSWLAGIYGEAKPVRCSITIKILGFDLQIGKFEGFAMCRLPLTVVRITALTC